MNGRWQRTVGHSGSDSGLDQAVCWFTYQRAKANAGYSATTLLQMLHDRRELSPAKCLINATRPSDCRTLMYKCYRLALTVEAMLVNNARCQALFAGRDRQGDPPAERQ